MVLLVLLIPAVYYLENKYIKALKNKTLRRLVSILSFIIVIAFSLIFPLFLSPLSPKSLGEVKTIYQLKSQDQERLAVLLEGFTGGKGSSKYYYNLLIIRMEDEEIEKHIKFPSRKAFSGRGTKIVSVKGPSALFDTRDGFWKINLWTGQIIGQEKDLVGDLKDYKRIGIRDGKLIILTPDGNEKALDIGGTNDDQQVVSKRLDSKTSCIADPQKAEKKKGMGGLLRASFLGRRKRKGKYYSSSSSVCRFNTYSNPVRLVIHRDTAFGTGKYYLSTVNDNDQILWTSLLEGFKDNPVKSIIVQQKDSHFRVLVKVKYTLYVMVLQVSDGKVLSKKELF
ncbi:MAG: hypothetical protein IEMM0008_0306 [bacterium]|nr:MAG: hypothetical protein IEMM0008_0306 [bacterium]